MKRTTLSVGAAVGVLNLLALTSVNANGNETAPLPTPPPPSSGTPSVPSPAAVPVAPASDTPSVLIPGAGLPKMPTPPTPGVLQPTGVVPPAPPKTPGVAGPSGPTVPPIMKPPKTPGVVGPVSPTTVDVDRASLITANSIGGIKLGMTMREAKRVASNATFERETDGDGVPLMWVSDEHGFAAELYYEYDYDVPEAPVRDDAVINFMSAWGEDAETAEGAKIDMRISDLERIYGEVKEIWMSEIESREYVEFANQPSGFSFRVFSEADSAGVYRTEERVTTLYASDAKLISIEVLGRFITNEESIGGIKLYDTDSDVTSAMATHSLGRLEKGESWVSDAIGAKIQTWNFPSVGLSVDMMSYEESEPKTVMSIRMTSPSLLKTAEGIGIGSDKTVAIQAYDEFINGMEEQEFFEGQDAHLVGSIYDGMVIYFDEGKVVEIFLGPSAE